MCQVPGTWYQHLARGWGAAAQGLGPVPGRDVWHRYGSYIHHVRYLYEKYPHFRMSMQMVLTESRFCFSNNYNALWRVLWNPITQDIPLYKCGRQPTRPVQPTGPWGPYGTIRIHMDKYWQYKSMYIQYNSVKLNIMKSNAIEFNINPYINPYIYIYIGMYIYIYIYI